MANRLLNKRATEAISGTVRFKSYGAIDVTKVKAEDESTEIKVQGFFTDDKMDEVGDIITKEATKGAVERWRQWGNIRTMHDFPSGRVESIGEKDGLAWNEIVTVPVDEQTQKLIEGEKEDNPIQEVCDLQNSPDIVSKFISPSARHS